MYLAGIGEKRINLKDWPDRSEKLVPKIANKYFYKNLCFL
jgi:hypothetical protein